VLLGVNEFHNLRRDPNARITIPYSTCSGRNLFFLGHASDDGCCPLELLKNEEHYMYAHDILSVA
jgi:hypothetical protein